MVPDVDRDEATVDDVGGIWVGDAGSDGGTRGMVVVEGVAGSVEDAVRGDKVDEEETGIGCFDGRECMVY